MNEWSLKSKFVAAFRRCTPTKALVALCVLTLVGYRITAQADAETDPRRNTPSSDASSASDIGSQKPTSSPAFGAVPATTRNNDDDSRERARRWLPGISPTLPTDEEWNEIGEFMQQYSPVRWALAQQSLSQAGRSELPRRIIFAQYMEMKKLEVSDPAEFKQRVGQIQLEDEIFQAESALREAETKQSADVSDLRSAFELKVKEHFDRELDAKEARIGRLESQIRQQRAALENEKRKASQTLQQRIEIAHKLSDWFRSWANGSLRLPFPRRSQKPEDGPPASPDSAPDATPGEK